MSHQTPDLAKIETPRDTTRASILSWVRLLGVALVAALLVRTFLVQVFSIPSESMLPTLEKGDRVAVERLSDRFGEVERGDVVVFHRPPTSSIEPSVHYLIKRVVGVPGDTLEARGGVVYVNGTPEVNPHLMPGALTEDLPLQRVPLGSYFLMGDNRENSGDSRIFGPVKKDLVVGRALVRLWPKVTRL